MVHIATILVESIKYRDFVKIRTECRSKTSCSSWINRVDVRHLTCYDFRKCVDREYFSDSRIGKVGIDEYWAERLVSCFICDNDDIYFEHCQHSIEQSLP